jgi:hypothetical protein
VYLTNEAAANVQFEGKWILTTGIVAQLESGSDGRYIVLLANDPLSIGDLTVPIVACVFEKSQEAKLAAITIGRQHVAIIGKVQGLIREDRARPPLVAMDNCELRPLPPEWEPNDKKK